MCLMYLHRNERANDVFGDNRLIKNILEDFITSTLSGKCKNTPQVWFLALLGDSFWTEQ